MDNLNEIIIAKYSREMKCSKTKLQTFANELLANVPKASSSVGSRGRQASSETLELRVSLKEYALNELKGKQFTVKELEQHFNVAHVTLNNALNYLKNKEGMFKQEGTKARNGRGRPEIVWSVNEVKEIA